MALKRNSVALGTDQMPEVNGPSPVIVRVTYAVVGALAVGDILELGDLPADAVPVDLIFDNDALGGTSATASVGLLNVGKTDLDTAASGGAAWLTASGVTAAAAVRADAGGLKAMSRCASAAIDRPFGIKINTVTASNGVVGVTLTYRTPGV